MSTSKNNKYKGMTVRQRGQSWQVDLGTRDGQRVQRSFKTKQEAKNHIDAHIEEGRIEGIDNRNKRVAIFDLTDKERMDIMTARDILPEHATFTEAIKFYVRHTAPHGGQKTVAQLLEDYVAEKEKANRREATVSEIRTRIGRLGYDFGESPVHEITTHDILQWMDKHEYRGVSRDNYRRAFVAFFNFAVKRGHAQANPAEAIDRVSVEERIPEILTPKEVQCLMYAAQEHAPRMVPYFAIGLFAGLRPAEIEETNWREIDLTTRRIRVRPEVAKKRRQRLVDLSDNLVEWLAPYREEQGAICFGRHDFDKVRRKAKVQWASDIMRHSYGSYHLAQHEDAAKTSLQMGHLRADVLYMHYRDLVTREDAETYWGIRPRSESNLIQLAAE